MLLASNLMPYAKANQSPDGSLAGISDAQEILRLFQNPTNNYDMMSHVKRTASTESLSNTHTKRTAVAVISKGLEYSTTVHLDNSFASRSGVLFANLGVMRFVHDVSHEYGHYRAALNEGAKDIKIKIDGFNRSSFEYQNLTNESPDARFRIMAAGLNQNSLNGLDSYRHSQLETIEYYHDLDKLYSRMYLQLYLSKPAGNENDDHTRMFDIMNEQGHDVTHSEFRRNSTMITFLSPDNWQSIINVGKFLYTGKRNSNPSYLQVKELGISLPSLSHFFTEDGDFVGYRQLFSYGEHGFEFSADHDLDFTHRRADLDRFRIGFTHHKRYLENDLRVSLFAHMTLQRSIIKPRGINLGIEATGRISNNLLFSGLAEVNKNDLMARVNGRGNGLWASIGLKYIF